MGAKNSINQDRIRKLRRYRRGVANSLTLFGTFEYVCAYVYVCIYIYIYIYKSNRLKILKTLWKALEAKLWNLDLLGTIWASLVAQLVKNPPAVWETCVQSLGWEDPLEKGTATHFSSGLEYSMDYRP